MSASVTSVATAVTSWAGAKGFDLCDLNRCKAHLNEEIVAMFVSGKLVLHISFLRWHLQEA